MQALSPSTPSFRKRLLSLVLPIAVQNLLYALVSASDALMLGMLDQSSLSAVSLATQVQFVLILFQDGLVMGVTVLVAQYWGSGNPRAVEKVQAIALRYLLLISVLFFLSALLLPEGLMQIFTKDAALIALGAPYLQIVSFSYLFTGFSQTVLCVMKSTGRTLRSTIYGSTAVVMNLLLNALLIFGLSGLPAMGIRGAALATVIARGIELLLTVAEAMLFKPLRFRRADFLHADRKLQGQFHHHTLPVLANELSWGLGFTMFSVIMGHLGSDAVAANAISQIVKNVAACVCTGIAAGAGIIIGNELGAGRLEEVKRDGSRLCRIAIIAGAVSGLVLLLSSPLLLRLSPNLSDTARDELRFMLFVCSYYMIGRSLNSTIINGIFCAGGDTRFGFLCDSINMWCIILPMGFLAAFVCRWPVSVVYFLISLDEFTKLPAEWHHYHQFKWVKNLTKP